MGAISSQQLTQQSQFSILAEQSQEDLRVLEWRANSVSNEFIPKAFFQYHQNKKRATFLDECKFNQNLPVNIKFEKYVGNLTLLQGKLCFEETLYVLKCLLSGFQVIHSFFGKAIVEPNFCFVNNQGQVKAWINDDYRKNSFYTESVDSARSNIQKDKNGIEKDKLFLKPQKWIDRFKPSSSPANLIQKILIMTSQLTFQQHEYKTFLEKVDGFITQNILKNYNFDRIQRFTNKYIYQKKIFVKTNLIEAIQRLYYENVNEKRFSSDASSEKPYSNDQTSSKDYRMQRHPSEMSRITQTSKGYLQQSSNLILKKCQSGNPTVEKKQEIQECSWPRKSDYFASTAHTKFNSTNNSNYFANLKQIQNLRNNPVFLSNCSSQFFGQPQILIQPKPNMLKNHISPQFSVNCMTITNKFQSSSSKISSYNPTPKSSFISNRSEMKNKNVEFKLQQKNLNVITERKQTDPQEHQIRLQKNSQFSKLSSKMQQKSSNNASQNSRRVLKQNVNIVEATKKSNISIGFHMQQRQSSLSVIQGQQKIRMFKSNCVDNEKQTRRQHPNFYTINKPGNFQQRASNQQKSRPQSNNFLFTMKTITKLIDSKQNISNQQESEGDFPSNQNVSSYSGILASMGRSVQVLDVPEMEKLNFRTDKKQRTMFCQAPTPIDKTTYMSYDKFQ